jgi:DUF971 family protein
MSEAAADDHPVEIRLSKDKRRLQVTFADGRAIDLSAEYLRVESPSAEVQGHGPGQKRLVSGKRDVLIRGIEPVGHYAIRLVFDDGHSTGIFAWPYLADLARREPELWARYLDELAAGGLSRGGAAGI